MPRRERAVLPTEGCPGRDRERTGPRHGAELMLFCCYLPGTCGYLHYRFLWLLAWRNF